jgi:hypothetical protein
MIEKIPLIRAIIRLKMPEMRETTIPMWSSETFGITT